MPRGGWASSSSTVAVAARAAKTHQSPVCSVPAGSASSSLTLTPSSSSIVWGKAVIGMTPFVSAFV
jgi:hypothetical protein